MHRKILYCYLYRAINSLNISNHCFSLDNRNLHAKGLINIHISISMKAIKVQRKTLMKLCK